MINTTVPTLALPAQSQIEKNNSKSFVCFWNWANYRNQTLTVAVFSKEGFSIANKVVKTPPALLWNISDVSFDLDDLNHFNVNVTNKPSSLYNVTITTMLLNQTNINFTSQSIPVDAERQLLCTFNWTDLRGKTFNLTLTAQDGSKRSKIVTIPRVGLKILGDSFIYGDLTKIDNTTIPIPILYFNVTVANSGNSMINVTINRITIQAGNSTYEIDTTLTNPTLDPTGHLLKIGENTTIMCTWNYLKYLHTGSVKVTIHTAEGFEASKTWSITVP
jgi:hypothetical protein